MLRILATAALAVALSACGRKTDSTPGTTKPPMPEPEGMMVMPPSDLQSLTYPTGQTRLTDTNMAGVFQPTASGLPESGSYGSVRLGNYGKLVLPRFHEGLDIAALERDAKGRPLDIVKSAMHGRVAMVNRVAGNSDYGLHVVLLHDDPVGTFYTLYAHMSEIDAAIREGTTVEPGARLGRMGNTALEPIPLPRAHLHFEIGLIANERFLTWPALPKKHTPGGKFNGQNLWGLNPILVFRDHEATGGQLTLLDHIQRVPVAVELLVRAVKFPDFFRRYPALWKGPDASADVLALSISEGAVLLAGRPATESEIAQLGRAPYAVLRVDEQELSRNGRRLVVKRDGQWAVGGNGENWISLLLH